jgi:hypothetical protein
MKRFLFCALALSLGAWAAPGAFGDTTFTLGFTGPDQLKGEVGATVPGDFQATMTHEGDAPGAKGWSLGVRFTGLDLVVESLTTAGTLAQQSLTGGFWLVEAIDPAKNGGKVGFVEAIVLHLKKDVVLPENTTSPITVFSVRATIPEGGGSGLIAYEDGLIGSGEPVPNNVTQAGETRIPVLVQKPVSLEAKPEPCTEKPYNFGFSDENITASPPWTGIAGADGIGGTILVKTPLGTVPDAHVFANIISQIVLPEGTDPTGKGISGWSMSVGLFTGESINLVDVTYGGTKAEPAVVGGFVLSEIVDMTKPDNAATGAKAGCVTACVLHLKKAVNLPLVGTESVLNMTVQGVEQQGEVERAVVFKTVSGLRGSGEPVPNSLTVEGETQKACNVADASATVVFTKDLTHPFLRGNANDDTKVDIADPIFLINAVFRQGPPLTCDDAADANDDGLVDASDVIYLVSFLFGRPNGSVSPPPPFEGGCGVDPTDEDGLTCKATQGLCD